MLTCTVPFIARVSGTTVVIAVADELRNNAATVVTEEQAFVAAIFGFSETEINKFNKMQTFPLQLITGFLSCTRPTKTVIK